MHNWVKFDFNFNQIYFFLFCVIFHTEPKLIKNCQIFAIFGFIVQFDPRVGAHPWE